MASTVTTRLFDLNIEKILEGWDLCHATRRLISNALEERALTRTTTSQLPSTGTKDGKFAIMAGAYAKSA